MARKLYHILAGIAFGRAEAQGHHFVAHPAILFKKAQHGRVALCLCKAAALCHGPEHGGRHLVGPLARNAHHSKPALARRRCQRGNGVFHT